MKKTTTLIAAVLLLAANSFSQNNEMKFKGWKTAKTEHFKFIYEDAQKEATQGFVNIADDAWNKIAKIYSFPPEMMNIYITGRTNIVNALTYSSPTEIVMFTNPCTLIDFTFRDNWQKLFFTHELIHAANFNFEERNKFLPKLFGPYFTNFDFMKVDGWALEGLTTVLETELTNGGRGRSPYFELEYKSLTLDNGFLPYDRVGLEMEPPRGQSYVIGYLLMRSIADRYGIQALADIERNRKTMGSWAESVKLITGQTPEDLYRDVRISLAKKYASERAIPEGLIISPRDVNTNYYKPAIVLDDGTLISLRTKANQKAAVVRLDPSARSGSNYLEDTNPEKDLNTVFKETILFSGNFMDTEAITADANGKIYATIGIQYNDKNPGVQLESALHSWTKEEGLKKLTKGISVFQPCVSRDGKMLVAVEQHGMQLRLVKIDQETGKTSVLLESDKLSFMQPSVNADGTKIAFLVLDDTRARIAVMETQNPQNYKIVANDDEKIYDPAYPTWNSDGTLTFCCNYRGRLEIFQIDEADSSVKPVVSDPIGATWAYKTDRGIFYTTKSSSGSVIKIKPKEEWGNVPNFEGPSPANEIMHFGHLQNDYPDFTPYTILSEVEDTSDENETKKSFFKQLDEEIEKNKSKNKEEPIPVKGKKIKHRSQELTEKAEASNTTITEITNEKPFIPLPAPELYTLFPSFILDSKNDKTYFGIGAFYIGIMPRLQLSTGLVFLEAAYYPELNNFDASFDCFIPIGTSQLDILSAHFVNFRNYKEKNCFVDLTNATLAYTLPIIHNKQNTNENALYAFTNFDYSLIRYAETIQPINGNFESDNNLYMSLGLDYYFSKDLKKDDYFSLQIIGIGTALYDMKDFYFGGEGELSFIKKMDNVQYQAELVGRYMPFPEYIYPSNSRVKYGGTAFDCSMPLRAIPRLSVVFPQTLLGLIDIKLYAEMNFFADKNFNFDFDKSIASGLEYVISQGPIQIATGASLKFEYNKKFSLDTLNFYLAIKYNWLRR